MNQFCEITPELRRLAAKSAECSKIDPELYTRYDVKRGLRDLNGKGVLVGLTEISEVSSTKIVNGESVHADRTANRPRVPYRRSDRRDRTLPCGAGQSGNG